MPSTTEFRKTITDPTPLYFAAGVIEKVRAEAPERIAKVRETDPKVVQERFQGALATLDADIKKLREQAQTLALQGVGYAAEAAVKAKESYDSLAEQGKSAVEGWRGQDDSADGASDTTNSGEGVTYETTIEREPVTPSVPKPAGAASKASKAKTESNGASETSEAPEANAARKTTAKKTTARKTTPKSGS